MKIHFLFFSSYLLIVTTLLMPSHASAQNMVPNNGFETFSALPNTYGQFQLATGWTNCSGSGSPDYFHTLGTVAGFFGQITPFAGNAQMGFATFHNTIFQFREYLSIPLTTPTVAGQTYNVSFYLTNGSGVGYTRHTNNIGVYFSATPPIQPGNTFIAVNPQVEITTIVSSVGVWTPFTFTFTATGVFNHITIGNFRDDPNTAVTSTGTIGAYYFIDEISVTPGPGNINITGDSLICAGTSATLFATGNNTYAWADSLAPATIISTDSVIVVSPAVTTTYYVYGDTDTAAFTVNVVIPSIISLGNDTTLCDGSSLTLTATATPTATYLWNNGTTAPTLNVTQSGTYSVQVNESVCTGFDTITVVFNPLPVVNLGNDTTLCDGTTLTLTATGTATATYLWSNGSTNNNITVTQPGTVWLTTTDNGCSATDSMLVAFNPIPNNQLGNDTTLCDGTTLTLTATATATATYLWSNGSTNNNITVTQPGTVWLTITDNGCSATDSLLVTFNPIPNNQLGNDTTLCDGTTLTLTATTTATATYLWSNGSTNNSITVTQPGTVWLTITDNGCSATDSLTVAFNPVPTVNLGNDTTFCDGASITFDATYPGATYLWSNNISVPTLTVTQTGIYWVTVHLNGCTATDTVAATVIALPVVELGNDTTLCDGTTLTLNATATTTATYLWSNGSTNNTITVTQPGTVWLTITDNGCSGTDSLTLSFNPVPTVNLGNDTTLCDGNILNLTATATATATYLWNNGSTNNSITVTQPGIIWLTVTDNNCSFTDTLLIDSEGCEVVFEMPNVFTPNGDGFNDLFVPIKNKGIQSATLHIFNRWGTEIATTSNIETGWNGGTLPDGTYFWIINYSTINNQSLQIKGSVLMIKN